MPKTLQCTLCHEKFDWQQVRQLAFYPSTGICNKCYQEAKDDEDVCFGKKDQFDKHNLACKRICEDRKICKLFIRMERYL